MWKLKGCPHCNGDLALYNSHTGWVENCLQCGFVRYLEDSFTPAEEERKTAWPAAALGPD